MLAHVSFPFSSYLLLINENETASNAFHSNDIINKQEQPEEEHNKVATCIKVKSADVNAGMLTKPTWSRSPKSSKQQSNSSFLLPNNAVIFKLLINCNRQKHNALQSFSKFIKLRQDLSRELNESNNAYCSGDNKYFCNINNEEASSSAFIILSQLLDSISDRIDANCYFALPSMSSSARIAIAAASMSHCNAGDNRSSGGAIIIL